MRRFDIGVIQIAAGVMGVLLLVIGLVTLARTGIPTESFTEPTTTVGPFGRTPLMGLIEVLLGVLVIGAAATADKGSVTAIGLIALVFGIVWMIEPGAFGELLGIGRDSAILYLLIGAVALATGLIGRGDRVVHERRIEP
jgi:hypothetical protein